MNLHRVLCFARVRPFLSDEDPQAGDASLEVDANRRCVRVGPRESYFFDGVMSPSTPWQEICNESLARMMREALTGCQNAFLFYGPTRGGKTYTMNQLLPFLLRGLFQASEDERLMYDTKLSMQCVGICLERITDLIDPFKKDLQLKELPDTGVYIRGATEVPIDTIEDFNFTWAKVDSSRSCNANRLNSSSTRGHCVVMLRVRRRRRKRPDLEVFSKTKDESDTYFSTDGRLYFADLTGSEEFKISSSEYIHETEVIAVNQSLLSLSTVINALANPKAAQVPFRDSKLTRLLQEPLGKNGNTCVILCLPPLRRFLAETRKALTFGQRAMKIVQHAEPRRNIDMMSYHLEVQNWLEERVHILEAQLMQRSSLTLADTTSNCHQCVQKDILLQRLSGEVKKLNEQIEQANIENRQSLNHLREALNTANNDCEYYKRRTSGKSRLMSSDTYERNLRALNEYWTGYTESLKQEMERIENERNQACDELCCLSMEVTYLKSNEHKHDLDIQGKPQTEEHIDKLRKDHSILFIEGDSCKQTHSMHLSGEDCVTVKKILATYKIKNQQEDQKYISLNTKGNVHMTSSSVHDYASLQSDLEESRRRAAEMETAVAVAKSESDRMCEKLQLRCSELEKKLVDSEHREDEMRALAERLQCEKIHKGHVYASLQSDLEESRRRAAEMETAVAVAKSESDRMCEKLQLRCSELEKKLADGVKNEMVGVATRVNFVSKPVKRCISCNTHRSGNGENEYFCCWRRKLMFSVSELSSLNESCQSRRTNGISRCTCVSVDVSNVCNAGISSLESTPVVLKYVRGLS